MSIIKKLSPLVSPDRWAGGWRQACVTNAINKKMIADLTTGTKIRLGEPLRFGGVVEDTFSVTSYRSGSKNRRCFATRTGMKVRIPTECLHGMVVVG